MHLYYLTRHIDERVILLLKSLKLMCHEIESIPQFAK